MERRSKRGKRKMKEQLTRLFQCAMFIFEKVEDEELKKTFTDEEIRYCKGIINYWKNKEEGRNKE